jgi:hypothetical protein
MHNMDNPMLIAAVVVAIIVVLAVTWLVNQRRRRTHLRERFGPEYDRTMATVGTAGKAAAVLEAREKRVSTYHIRPLTEDERQRFSDAWQRTQSKFVDEPQVAVTEADALVTEVMTARGYPMADFDRRAEDLTVEHGNVVQHYRAAREIVGRQANHRASTEDLRQALVHYRELFSDLLNGDQPARRTA